MLKTSWIQHMCSSLHFYSISLGSDGTKCKRLRMNDCNDCREEFRVMFVQPIQGLLGVASVLV